MKNLAPYQIFFPIGILSALLAVGVWIVQNSGWFVSSALLIHSKLILGGFLWSFIVGFLMTAIPRMTATPKAESLEVLSALALILFQIYQSWNIDGRWFYATNAALIFFLIFFGGRRILAAKKTPPVFFSHVALGMVLALLGCVYHYRGNMIMGLHLYHVGAVLLLVLGIGTRFFSFLSGLPSVFESAPRNFHWLFHGMGLLTGISLFLAGKGYSGAYLILTVLSLTYLFFVWKVYRPSPHPSPLKYGVRIVAVLIPLSFFLCWLFPPLFITWFHLLFIGCFSLLSFAVATRVTLAHGSYPLILETKAFALKIFVACLALALIFRIFYGVYREPTFLSLAVGLWIIAISCWCFSFMKKIFVPGRELKPSC